LHGIKTNGLDEKVAIKLLTEAAQIRETEGSQLEKQLFNYIYNSTGNMAVLIDGVDEVSPHYTEEIIQILRILSKTKIRQIWVTSRNSVKDRLKQELQCQSYSLVPFSVEDQKSFLVKFWNQKFSHIEAVNLESLALKVVELSSKHLSVREKNFMGIPLQSMLLAEMFEENLKHCTSRMVELPEYINLFMLYDFYLKKKWDIYLSDKKYSDRTNVNAITDDDALYDIFMDNHKAAALMAILSTQNLEKLKDKNVLKKGSDFVQKINQGLEKTGIITNVIEGRPVFLHRTFAEYLVASWLCDNNLVSQVFMRDHLFEPEFGVVRSMVDRILADKYVLHEGVLNSDVRHIVMLLQRKESITQKDRGGRTPLHVAVSCRSLELTSLLLEYGADVSSVDTLLGWSPVDYATRMVDWQMLSLLMEKRPDIREQVLNEMNPNSTEYIPSAVRAAARYGHSDLLRYLISKGNCVNMTLPGDSGTLLHEAARENNIQTVSTLFDLGADFGIQDSEGKTALHVSAEVGSLEVAKFIVERQEMSDGEAEIKEIGTLDRTITKLNRLNVRDDDGNTPLHLAAAAGNTSTVRYLLSAGSDLRSCKTRGEHPITLAARYGRNDTVKLLMKSCFAVKCEEMTSALTAAILAGQVDTTALLLRSSAPVSGGENEKPIHIASRIGQKEIVSLLLEYGASLTSRTDSGNTALHLASEAGHMSLVKYLVELNTDGVYTLNYENETPLNLVARNGRDYLLSYFAENGCNINSTSANGATCLHVACENGHYATVECLLKHGAEVNAMNSADQTPLHIAASRGQTKIVELLFLHNANFSMRDKAGITALLAASINGHQNTVLFIVQHGGNIEETDGKGNTIAHFAVQNENFDILKFLSKQQANLYVQNSDGDTPLHQAVREEKSRIVEYLAAKESDVNTQGKDGMKPLDVAILKDNMEITRLLLERNARSCKAGIHIVAAARFGFLDLLQRFVAMGEDIKLMADHGESTLHAACKSGQVSTVQYLCEHGAVLDLQDSNGNTALHVAVNNDYLDVTRVLVEKGANMCAADASGSTALHIAAKGGHVNIVQYLADSFAPIDLRNARKETALLVAAAEGHEKIVRVLIEQGAGIGVRDIKGKTALDIATEKGYIVIIELLKDRAEGRKLVCSNSHTAIHTAAEGGSLKHLQISRNARLSTCIVTETETINIDTPLMSETTAESTMQFSSNPRSALHTAAENGNLEEVQRLVEDGIALDCGDPFGRTALWGVAKSGHVSIMRILLDNGSCVNIPDCEGLTPMDIAAREGQLEAVYELLRYNAAISPKVSECLKDQLHQASEFGDLQTVMAIFKCGNSVQITNIYGCTPLHVSANCGHKELSRTLLGFGVSALVNVKDKHGRTPLILSATNGHIDIVRELLCHDTILDNADEHGITPLYAAAEKGHVEVVRELLHHGARVNIADKAGVTPLLAASQRGHVDVVRELKNHGAQVNTTDVYFSTHLSAPVSKGSREATN
jgi:ankyrin repeat protein